MRPLFAQGFHKPRDEGRTLDPEPRGRFMVNDALAPIEELLRIPSPAPRPQGLACDGSDLWIGSIETSRIYGVRAQTGAVFEEGQGPGEPIGLVVIGDSIRVVSSEGADGDRFIRRYVMGHGFKSEAIRCPDSTGSFLAWDGDHLFLSQRYEQRILELDPLGAVIRTIPVPRQIIGMTIVNGRFVLMTCVNKECDDVRVLRVDARKESPEVTELAGVPFIGRSLAWDGNRYWTAAREENALVAFTIPEA
jgi:hypothetical protein